MIGITGIVIMILLFLTRMPVAFVMASVGFVGFSVMITHNAGLVLLSRNVYEVFGSYDLTTWLLKWGLLHRPSALTYMLSTGLQKIFKGIFPFLLAVIVGVIILIIFPQIILFLPQLMY